MSRLSVTAVVVIRSRYLKGKVQARTRLESLDCAAQTGKLAQVWSCLHLHVSLQVSEPFDIMQVPARRSGMGGEARFSLSCEYLNIGGKVSYLVRYRRDTETHACPMTGDGYSKSPANARQRLNTWFHLPSGSEPRVEVK